MSDLRTEVMAELLLLGAAELWRPKHCIGGPFTWLGVVTDNATTDADLTADANNIDMAIQRLAGSGADAGVVVIVTGVDLIIEKGTETEIVYADILESVYLAHQGADYEERINLGPYARTRSTAVAVEDTNTATAVFRNEDAGGGNIVRELPNPWIVYVRTDTFTVSMRAAVDTVANVPFQLHTYGAAMRESVAASIGLDVTSCQSQANAARIVKQRLGRLALGKGAGLPPSGTGLAGLQG